MSAAKWQNIAGFKNFFRLITTVVHYRVSITLVLYVFCKEVIRNVGIFLEKTRETKSKQVKQTGQLAAAAAAGLHEHDAVVCSLLLRRRRGRRKRKKSGEEQCKIRCHLS